MIDYKYYEYDGMDPGLQVSSYDGAEYELDDFGERIGSEDLAQDQSDEALEEELIAEGHVDDSFRESIKPEDIQRDHQADDQKTQAT